MTDPTDYVDSIRDRLGTDEWFELRHADCGTSGSGGQPLLQDAAQDYAPAQVPFAQFVQYADAMQRAATWIEACPFENAIPHAQRLRDMANDMPRHVTELLETVARLTAEVERLRQDAANPPRAGSIGMGMDRAIGREITESLNRGECPASPRPRKAAVVAVELAQREGDPLASEAAQVIVDLMEILEGTDLSHDGDG